MCVFVFILASLTPYFLEVVPSSFVAMTYSVIQESIAQRSLSLQRYTPEDPSVIARKDNKMQSNPVQMVNATAKRKRQSWSPMLISTYVLYESIVEPSMMCARRLCFVPRY